jgi:hypothetical protein
MLFYSINRMKSIGPFLIKGLWDEVMVFNTTFNNISWQSVLLVEETRIPGENH